MSESLSLNCFVFGDEPDRVFTVRINKNKNVRILKDLIMEEKASHLNHVDASDLVLWKVDLSIDDLKAGLADFELDPQSTPLKSLLMFEDVRHQDIHVLVKAPGMSRQSSLPKSHSTCRSC